MTATILFQQHSDEREDSLRRGTADDCLTPGEQSLIVATIAKMDGNMLKEDLIGLIKGILFVMNNPRYCWANQEKFAVTTTDEQFATEVTQDFVNIHCNVEEKMEDGGMTYLFVDPMSVPASTAAFLAAGMIRFAVVPSIDD